MPDEEAQVEPVAESETPASPEADLPEGESAGDVQEEPEEGKVDYAGFFKGLDADQLRLALQSVDPDVRQSALEEDLRRSEQRGRTQAEEEFRNRESRADAYQQLIANGDQANNWLRETIPNIPKALRKVRDALDDDERDKTIRDLQAVVSEDLNYAIEARVSGEVAKVSQRNAKEVTNILAKHADLIGQLSDEEGQRIQKSRYEDAQKGSTSTLGVLIELLVQRAEQRGVEKGQQAGEKAAIAKLRLAEQMEKVAAAKNGAEPIIEGGKPSSTKVPTPAEYNAMSSEQRAALSKEVKDQIAARALR